METHNKDIEQPSGITLLSTRSTEVSLLAVKSGKAGLDAHRKSMLNKVPKQGNWARFRLNSIVMKDLAYLSAKVGDEFALLRGKNEDILFHGRPTQCNFIDDLEDMLRKHQLEIVGHAHPGEVIPVASMADRATLREIGQTRSIVISAMSGRISEFGPDPFEV